MEGAVGIGIPGILWGWDFGILGFWDGAQGKFCTCSMCDCGWVGLSRGADLGVWGPEKLWGVGAGLSRVGGL